MIQFNYFFPLHLFLVLLLPSVHSIQSSPLCNRSCGYLVVPYPFGFSNSCKIPLNCTDKKPQIGEFTVNVTPDSILVNLPAKCDRPIQDIAPLFSRHYAPSLDNGLLLQNCTTKPSDCAIPKALFESQFGSGGCGLPVCYSLGISSRDNGCMKFSDLKNSSCKFMYSSVAAVNGDNTTSASLDFQTVVLDWGLEGDCNCSSHAKCIASPEKTRFRCKCSEGFRGDGFLAGNGCFKVAGKSTRQKLIIGGSIGAGGVLLLVLLLVIYGKSCYSLYNSIGSSRRRIIKGPTKAEAFIESYGSLSLQSYKYLDIKKMTNSFKDTLGQGGYGCVFKGKLHNGQLVAVKVLNESKGKGDDFINEVAAIGRTNHVNVVSLLGFCMENNKQALVYEFMPNGSLEKFIYSDKESSTASPLLGLEKLYQITLGIARGLEYLHRGCNTRILHLDIKPHNILLDQDFCPKISDFGLAKLCPTKESIVSMVGTRGTPGYIAPEVYCGNFGGVSHKSDVYSYGMMVLEMIGGRKNIDVTVEKTSEIYFPQWIYKRLRENIKVEGSEKNELGISGGVFEEETAQKMIRVALWCIQAHPGDRPSMTKVVDMLEGNIEDLQLPPNPFPDPSSRPFPSSS